MLTGYSNQTLIDRFFRYTSIDTQSNPASDTQPSTARQLDLSRVLLQELRDMGYEESEIDSNGYLYATIPSNSPKQVPVICFCARGYFP